MNFILKYKLAIIGILVGAISGFAYYHFIGCASGTCAITSKRLNSTLYGALMGGLLLSSFKKKKTKTE
ncbi:MAG: DUF6132 family protein [Ferruginibacter sp.]